MNGNEVAREIRALDTHSIMILASGHFDPDEINHHQSNGFVDIFEKDFSQGPLQQVLEHALSLNEQSKQTQH